MKGDGMFQFLILTVDYVLLTVLMLKCECKGDLLDLHCSML